MSVVKECQKCHTVKRLDEFYFCNRNSHGRKTWCKDCTDANVGRLGEYNRPLLKFAQRWGMIGIPLTEEWVSEIVEDQNNKCDICKTRPLVEETYRGARITGILSMDYEKEIVYGIICKPCHRVFVACKNGNIDLLEAIVRHVKTKREPRVGLQVNHCDPPVIEDVIPSSDERSCHSDD